MRPHNPFPHGLPVPPRDTLLRWAGLAQWFGLVMLLLSIGLAALTDSLGDSQGVSAVTLCGGLALVGARLLIGRGAPDDDEPPR